MLQQDHRVFNRKYLIVHTLSFFIRLLKESRMWEHGYTYLDEEQLGTRLMPATSFHPRESPLSIGLHAFYILIPKFFSKAVRNTVLACRP